MSGRCLGTFTRHSFGAGNVCLRLECAKPKKKRDTSLSGKFGRLTVLRFSHADSDRRSVYVCRCDCGRELAVVSRSLLTGNTVSCGCFNLEKARAPKTHGMSDSPEYRAWCAMWTRCTNPSRKDYKHYGGRGITVCERWNGFESFLEDMGPRPVGLTLDRINTNGNYEPGNCRWITQVEQKRNTRRNKVNPEAAKVIRFLYGVKRPILLARLYKVNVGTAYRIAHGQSWA